MVAAAVQTLKREHAATVAPLAPLLAEAARLERRLSDLVNAACGLTPEEIALMRRTAPPRTPLREGERRPGARASSPACFPY